VEMQMACVGVLLEVIQRYSDDAKLVEQVIYTFCHQPQENRPFSAFAFQNKCPYINARLESMSSVQTCYPHKC